jgi:hypothetical protein
VLAHLEHCCYVVAIAEIWGGGLPSAAVHNAAQCDSSALAQHASTLVTVHVKPSPAVVNAMQRV